MENGGGAECGLETAFTNASHYSIACSVLPGRYISTKLTDVVQINVRFYQFVEKTKSVVA